MKQDSYEKETIWPKQIWRIFLMMVVGSIGLGLTAPGNAANFVKRAEINSKNTWANKNLLKSHKMPFSFVYGGQASDKLLTSWSKKNRNQKTRSLSQANRFHLDRSENRARNALRCGRVRGLSGCRMDGVFQKQRHE